MECVTSHTHRRWHYFAVCLLVVPLSGDEYNNGYVDNNTCCTYYIVQLA